ncbi:hypothetical protein MAPG_01208 [Magnaporthiopsis poae ATCC 64411]|uniref:Prion-inhibition and propagation HeLo domain-containing protein n=1 Tax=Magnaporthiopsis poae (strain ATCC 64411 / 73-15) TaxID=644358 RepID=A0A0C4DN34_MAGP6|nr:hypothetical protein MAPG_01208 [Magnaporthiopsis poae ATCC 64411]
MTDPASLIIGAIPLAALFTTCIDGFAYIRAGQNLERDLQIILVKLDIEKARLLSWGNAVGIVRGIHDGRHSALNDQSTEARVRSILESVRVLLTDSQTLEKKYALQEIPEPSQTVATGGTQRFDVVSRASTFWRSYNRFRSRFGTAQDRARVGIAKRTTWAVHDRERFREFVADLHELIDGLEDVAPDAFAAAERVVEDDVGSLRLSSLRLVGDALGGDVRYQALADVISEATQATEDGRTGQWLDDQSDSEVAQPEAAQETTQNDRPMAFRVDAQCFMMFTPQCESERTNTRPCIQTRRPFLSYFEGKSILAVHAKSWHPGYRIGSRIVLEEACGLDSMTLAKLRLGLQRRSLGMTDAESETSSAPTDDSPYYIADVFIYCPPCTRLVDTAVDVCNSLPDPLLLRRLIRIDERLPCTCLDRALALEALQAILEQIQHVESNTQLGASYLRYSRAEYVDRDFLEERIMALEEELSAALPATPDENMRRILANHRYTDNLGGLVILGEHQNLGPLAQLPAFPKKARVVRENEIWVFFYDWNEWKRDRIGTFTTKGQN